MLGRAVSAVLTGAAAAAVYAIFASVLAADLPIDILVSRWAQPPSRFVRAWGMDVHIREVGPLGAPAVVLLPGTSADLHTWDGWADALAAAGMRVLSMDLPAFGLTGPYPDDRAYTVENYADFVVAVIDAAGYGGTPVSLGGNSLGGQVALEVALRHPSRVARLVLVDAAGTSAPYGRIPIGFAIAQFPALAPLVARVLPRIAVERSVTSVYGDPRRIAAGVVDRYFDMARRPGNRRALFRRMAARREELSDDSRLRTIAVPTLVLWGGRDELIPVAAGRILESSIPNARLLVFADLGHIPHEEDPARTVAPVVEFLATA